MKKMMLALAVGWLVAGIPAMAATRHLDLAPGSITGDGSELPPFLGPVLTVV